MQNIKKQKKNELNRYGKYQKKQKQNRNKTKTRIKIKQTR